MAAPPDASGVMAPLQMQQMLINQNAMFAALTAHIGGGGAGPASETARFAKLAGEWDKLTGWRILCTTTWSVDAGVAAPAYHWS